MNWRTFEWWLEGYPPDKKAFIISGFQTGFKLGHEGPRHLQNSSNLPSALDNASIVADKIATEVHAGRVSGPHTIKPFDNLKISPLGIVPKKNPGEYRLIHHLSYPKNSNLSVNANIPDDAAAVSYAGIQEAISHIKRLGRGCYMSKTDIRSAFRICPVHASDHELLGFAWEGKVYYDLCLPFGARSSCQIFEAISSALEWIALNKLGCPAVVHVLDDFLFLNTTKSGCAQNLDAFIAMCRNIGIPIAWEKTFPPHTVMVFVGISLCSLRLEASLPLDKLEKCNSLLKTYCTKDSCKLRELQALLGYLNFCCSVITCGRAFLRRLIDLTIGIEKPYFHVRLGKEAKADMQLWLSFLSQYNGKSMFINESFLSNHTLSLYTDSAQSLGYGAVYGSQWFYGAFPPTWQKFSITFLELYPIVLAANVWGQRWQNHSILFYTDNEALVFILNKQTSKDTKIMKLLRPLVLACLHYNVLFQAKHVRGARNTLADALSRLEVQRFRKLSPNSNQVPTEIPSQLRPDNFFAPSRNCLNHH